MKLFKYKKFNESRENFWMSEKERIHSTCKKYGITNYTITDDGKVDVDGSVNLSSGINGIRLSKLPLKFGRVSGTFNCSHNKLTSFEGFPYTTLNLYCHHNSLFNMEGCPEVINEIWCFSNNLTSLKGCPEEISGDFWCMENNLTNLIGGPKKVGDSYYCNKNKLVSLEGCASQIGGIFNCASNKLESLEGSPNVINDSFMCHENLLTTLEGGPKKVLGGYSCSNNRLINFNGCGEVFGNFECLHNLLSSVEGFPPSFSSNLNIRYNKIEELFDLFPTDRWGELPEFLNEYDVIRDGDKVVMQALELVYDELGLEVPENIELDEYDII